MSDESFSNSRAASLPLPFNGGLPMNNAQIEREFQGVQNVLTSIQRQLNEHECVLNENGMTDLKKSVTELNQLINGDERLGLPGLRKEMQSLYKSVQELINQRNQIKWLLIGMGLTSGISAGTVVSLVTRAMTVP